VLAGAAVSGPAPASTEYDQYGYAGLSWVNYDQPCLVPNVGADVETMLGDWGLGIAKVIVAADNTAHSWAADPAWMSAVIPIVTGSASTLYRALFLVWAGVALMTVAISVVFRAHRSDASGAVTLTAWAVLVIALVAAAAAAPGWAGQQAQSLMGSTLSALDSGFAGPGSQASAGQAHDSLLVQSVLYPAWLRGELGNPDSATARQYGPVLLSDQALTWAQAAGTPARVAAITKTDQTAWAKAAAQVQKTDPESYSVLTGNSMDRLGAGVLALVTALVVCTFDLIASMVVIGALLGVLAGTVMLPAVGAAGMHHRLRHLITGIGSRVLGMLLNAVLWAAAAGIDEVATRALLTQNILPLPMVLLLLAMLPAALWIVIRRLRGRRPVPPLAKKLVMMGLGYRVLRRGARGGAQEGAQEGVREAVEEEADGPAGRPGVTWRVDTVLINFGVPFTGGWRPPAGALGGAPPPDGPADSSGDDPPAGSGDYTGGGSDSDEINPTRIFRPGENPDDSDDGDGGGFYDGGGA
jgi:hypothetical protein